MKVLSGQNLKEDQSAKLGRFEQVERAYEAFLSALGYDWENDPNMKGTPKRVAKMYLNEVTQGTYDLPPKITTFPNQGNYDGIAFQGEIDVKSLCSHHMQPFVGKAYIAYVPGNEVIGLSKINRIVEYFARRPQLQEQLTSQIHEELSRLLKGNQGVAVFIEAQHMCVSLRGVNQDSKMKTAKLSGIFQTNENNARSEFYSLINNK